MAGLRHLVAAALLLYTVQPSLANSPPTQSREVNSRIIARLNKTTRLECPVENDQPEMRAWHKYGQEIRFEVQDRLKKTHGGHLRIKNTQMEDAGNYTCIATNGFGTKEINYTVVVKDDKTKIFQEGRTQYRLTDQDDLSSPGSLPYFVNREKMTIDNPRRQGTTVLLKCKVAGNPRPKVKWLRNGSPYKDYKDWPQDAQLKVEDLQENANYSCLATNRLGQVNYTYNVQVISGDMREPRLTAPHPSDQTAVVGQSVSFQCFIESPVKPTVQWLKVADDIQQFSKDQILKYHGENFIVLKNKGNMISLEKSRSFLNKLLLPSVQPKDAGIYVCAVVNQKGFKIRRATLKVEGVSNPPYGGDSHLSGNYNNYNPGDSSLSPHDGSSTNTSTDNSSNLPLLIGLPACVVLFIIIITVFLVQRNNHCNKNSSPPGGKPTRPPVPVHEREAYYYSNCHPHQQTVVNPLLINSRDKLPKTPTPSVDLTSSEFSSVSRTHPPQQLHYYHHHHNNLNYGY